MSNQEYRLLPVALAPHIKDAIESCGAFNPLTIWQAIIAAHDLAEPPVAQPQAKTSDVKAAFEEWARKDGTYDLRGPRVIPISHGGVPHTGYIKPYENDRTRHTFEGYEAAQSQASAAPVLTDAEPEECWSADKEDYNSLSLEELIERNEHLQPGMTVHVGKAHRPESNRMISADDVIDQMADRAYDIASEHCDGYPDVSKEAKAELEALLAEWVGKHAAPTFYEVLNVKPYILSTDDFPDCAAPVECHLAATPAKTEG